MATEIMGVTAISTTATTILAFDIGIKNLAWCCLQKQETVPSQTQSQYRILGWDNYNLLSDSSNVAPVKQTCPSCKVKGLYETSADSPLYCAKHCPKPALRDVSGNLLKTIPKMVTCKAILEAKNVKPPVKKAAILAELAKLFCLPRVVAKVSKATDVGLTEIHDGIRRLVQTQKGLWQTCTKILLENQPVLKNPTMKSVQILLFATLRDLIPSCPPVKLVHAGKKVKGVETGDAGYKERKAGSETRAARFLEDTNLQDGAPWKSVWDKATKKSDLADALSMCLDAVA